jgi:hypothetical protein
MPSHHVQFFRYCNPDRVSKVRLDERYLPLGLSDTVCSPVRDLSFSLKIRACSTESGIVQYERCPNEQSKELLAIQEDRELNTLIQQLMIFLLL